tara:strand:+ start:258 stop:776 length:519 start_codon:yes stop_codon:yes gene_type:complete
MMSEVSRLIEANNPILRNRVDSVSEDCDREKVKQDLIDSMQHYKGIGLSANQIGIMERVFVMYENVEERKIIACFNPKIVGYSKEVVSIDEGCLSYPGIWLKIKRPYAIKVEFEDETGKKHEKEFRDLTSRIFQHEYDHMEGTDFTRLASPLKLERAIKKLKKKIRQHKLSK